MMIWFILSVATLLEASLLGSCQHTDAQVTTTTEGVTMGPWDNLRVISARLVDEQGSPSQQGTLELDVWTPRTRSREWLPICDTALGISESKVICRELGYELSSISHTSLTNQISSMTYLQFNIHCYGDELELSQCSYTFQDEVENCSSAAVVTCTPGCKPAKCTEGDLCLFGGNTDFEGRLEVCMNGSWATMTFAQQQEFRYTWTSPSANVACRQLGLPWEWAVAEFAGTFGRQINAEVVRSGSIRCTGSEQSLLDCPRAIPYSGFDFCTNCVVGLICQGISASPITECRQDDVRLTYGKSETEGRVNICVDGRWAAPCGYSWGETETHLTCKELGFSTNGSQFIRSFPGIPYYHPGFDSHSDLMTDSDHSLLLVEMECGDDNETLSDCRIRHDVRYCTHKSTVFVICGQALPEVPEFEEKLSAGAIGGIVVGVIVLLAAVVTIVIAIIIVSVKRANLDKGSERHENEYVAMPEKA